jgi:hypothetical protein
MAWNAIDEEAARPRMAEGAQKRVGEGEGQ